MEKRIKAHPDQGNPYDQEVMSTFHYKQELRRSIRMFGSFAVAFYFISITTGIFANYELVLDRSGPAGIWTWPVVIVGQLLVALVFAELAAKMPLTGYSYQWVTRLGGNGWGWFTGWVSVCFLIIVIPSVDHGIAIVVGQLEALRGDDVPLDVFQRHIHFGAAKLQLTQTIARDRIDKANSCRAVVDAR